MSTYILREKCDGKNPLQPHGFSSFRDIRIEEFSNNLFELLNYYFKYIHILLAAMRVKVDGSDCSALIDKKDHSVLLASQLDPSKHDFVSLMDGHLLWVSLFIFGSSPYATWCYLSEKVTDSYELLRY